MQNDFFVPISKRMVSRLLRRAQAWYPSKPILNLTAWSLCPTIRSVHRVVTYLLRHGETERNRHHRNQGTNDSPLTPRGKSQAISMANTLHTVIPNTTNLRIQSSLRGRAVETAKIIGRSFGIPVSQIERDPLLNEISSLNHPHRMIFELSKKTVTRRLRSARAARPHCGAEAWATSLPGLPCALRGSQQLFLLFAA